MADEVPQTQEQRDAAVVNAALSRIASGELAAAEAMLQAVAANTPADYRFETVSPTGKRSFRFWDQIQFVEFVTRNPEAGRDIVWLGNAYGRAHYYLAFIAVAQKRYADAIPYLDAGIRLEPDQPHFQIEMGRALCALQEYDAALEVYEGVLQRRDALSQAVRAMALRGAGSVRIETGDLTGAKRDFLESQTLDPKSDVAAKELAYIDHLVRGGSPSRTESVVTQSGRPITVCPRCGKQVSEGRLVRIDGKLAALCPACHAAASQSRPSGRPWWKFGRR